VTLTGSGSTWNAKQSIFVGFAGAGSLTVGSGRNVTTTGTTVTNGLGTMK